MSPPRTTGQWRTNSSDAVPALVVFDPKRGEETGYALCAMLGPDAELNARDLVDILNEQEVRLYDRQGKLRG